MDNLSEFIKGIELHKIILKELKVKLLQDNPPSKIKVDMEVKTEHFEDDPNLSFLVNMNLKFTDKNSRKIAAKISIVLKLIYTSQIKPEKEILDNFSKSSVILNAWPYLRFWIQSIVQNFGWPSFTLPLFKLLPEGEKG